MRVTLIRPPAVSNRFSFTAGSTIPPVGLAYLVACADAAGHDVTVIDSLGEGIREFRKIAKYDVLINGISPSEILKAIPKDTEIIGMSCMFSSEWFYDDYIIKLIRAQFPRVPIVIGGEHVTAEWQNLLRVCPEIDYCVLGEGEETLLELLRCLQLGHDLHTVNGIAYRFQGQPKKNSPRRRSKKLDDMPLPAWDKLPIRNYHDAKYSMSAMNRVAIPLIASRGCPFSCTFCSAPQMWGNELSYRSPRSVVDEIKLYVKKYGIDHVDFLDIVGVINRKWTQELLTLMVEENLPVTWHHGAGTRSEILDKEMLNLFKKSKTSRISYAPESGSEETIARIQKRINFDKMTAAMIYTNKLGIPMRAPLIFGFPGQTLKEAFQNVRFALKMTWLGVDDVVCHAFAPYPGSQYHRELVESKRIDLEKLITQGTYNDFLRGAVVCGYKTVSWSEHIPNWMLPLFQFGTMALHYSFGMLIRPWRLWKSLKRSFWTKKPLTFFDHALVYLTQGTPHRAKFESVEEDEFTSWKWKANSGFNQGVLGVDGSVPAANDQGSVAPSLVPETFRNVGSSHQ